MRGRPFIGLRTLNVNLFAYYRQRGLGHGASVETIEDRLLSLSAELFALGGIVSQSAQSQGEVGGIVWVDENPAAGRLDQLGKRPVPRLYYRDAVGHRFEHVQSLRFTICRRHRQYVDRLEEAHLAGVVGRLGVAEIAEQSGLAQPGLLLLEVGPIVLPEPAGDAQLR